MEDINRGTGRTTRLVDSYIQELFNNKEINVKDHFEHKTAHSYLVKRIINRFNNELNRGHLKLVVNDLNIKLIYNK